MTPGAEAGELLHVLSSLERRSSRWDTDIDGARAALSAADLAALLPEVVAPPLTSIGALGVDAFLPKRARRELAAALNTLLAAPTFASWRKGLTLDIGEWMQPVDGRTPATVLSVAHLDDDERALVLGVVLEEVLSWVRGLSGSQRLRALIVFDEVYGFLPPHPASPPTKRPLVALMKQARAYGVGVYLRHDGGFTPEPGGFIVGTLTQPATVTAFHGIESAWIRMAQAAATCAVQSLGRGSQNATVGSRSPELAASTTT